MSHERLLMPHPVLRPEGSDYGDGDSFSMTASARRVDQDVVVEASFNLSCRALDDMIKSGSAKFFVLAKCQSTYYRKSESSNTPVLTLSISFADLQKTLTLSPYIIASKDIPWFATGDKADLDNVQGDPIPSGSILAVGETSQIKLGKVGTLQSTIKLSPNPAIDEGIYLVNSRDEFVVVEMGPKTFRAVSSMRQRAAALLYPSIYQAAVEFAIREMAEHEQSMWAQALQKTLADHKIEVNDDLAKQAHKHAQTLLNKPLDKMVAWSARTAEDLD